MQGDLDQGLSEIASASRIYPLAMLQYFPSLLPDPKAALATMDKTHMSRGTRVLLGIAPRAAPTPDAARNSAHGQAVGGAGGGLASSQNAAPSLVLPYLVTFRSRMLSRAGSDSEKEVRRYSRPGHLCSRIGQQHRRGKACLTEAS